MIMAKRQLILLLGCTVSALVGGSAAHAVLVTVATPVALTISGNPYLSYSFAVDPQSSAIIAFDVEFTSALMNQVHPMVTDKTVFQNDNIALSLTSAQIAEDSQLDILWGAGIWTGALPSPTVDTSTSLIAGIGGPISSPVTTMFGLAHVVLPATGTGDWEFTYFTSLSGSGTTLSGQFGAVPEASQVIAGAVLTTGLLGIYIARRLLKRSVAGQS